MVGDEVIAGATLAERLEAALDDVRPALRADGGDVWLVRVEGPRALVQMAGACGGCAMASGTLRNLIEAAVRARCPEIATVEHV